jgi:DNA-binding MarR family transcriptional regulator
VDTRWLNKDELATWVRVVAVLELLPNALDAQLRRDSDLTNFDYYVLAMLSEADGQTLRMTALAAQTNAALPRLSHVVRRLEDRGLVERKPCPEDGRATNAHLTQAGRVKLMEAAPGHVANVREHVIDALTPQQVEQLGEIADAMLSRLDPSGRMTPMYRRHDEKKEPGA